VVVVVASVVVAGAELDPEVTVVVDVWTGMMTGAVPLSLELALSLDAVVLALVASLLTLAETELVEEEAVAADEEPEEEGTGMTTGTVGPALFVCAGVDSLDPELDGGDDCVFSAAEVGDEFAVAGPTTIGLVAVAKEVTLDVDTAGPVYGENVVLAKNDDNSGNAVR